jgi:hypothetical protein
LDWIFQLACRDSASGPDWIYVADEWGGLELWKSVGMTLTLDLDHHRVATGMFALGMWSDGSRIYSVREGGGLWFFDESDPHHEQIAVEWIDRTDPGCDCAGCCPPATGEWPYPPAIFVSEGATNQGRVAVLGQDRNTAVAGEGYFMLFEQDQGSGEYQCIYSDPLGHSGPVTSTWGSNLLSTHGELVFASLAARPLRLYQHCPGQADQVRFLGEIATPSPGDNLEFADVAVYGDYLFVAEVHHAPLAVPDSGQIHVYRWKQGDLNTCPNQPSLLNPPQYLGAFGADVIPHTLLVDMTRNRLIVGCTSKTTFPIKEGAVLFYDLGSFNPANPADMDQHRTSHSPAASMRVTYPNVYGLTLSPSGDLLYVADPDNGLYQYSLNEEVYVGFYPAQRGTTSQAFEPQMVRSPRNVMPLHTPIAVAHGARACNRARLDLAIEPIKSLFAAGAVTLPKRRTTPRGVTTINSRGSGTPSSFSTDSSSGTVST